MHLYRAIIVIKVRFNGIKYYTVAFRHTCTLNRHSAFQFAENLNIYTSKL